MVTIRKFMKISYADRICSYLNRVLTDKQQVFCLILNSYIEMYNDIENHQTNYRETAFNNRETNNG